MKHIESLRRRHLLVLGAVSAAAASLPRGAWSQPRFAANPFTMGVASGSPTSDSLVLWTRLHGKGAAWNGLAQGPVAVRWELAHDEQFARMVQSGQVSATPELAHCVHAEVSGLEPDRWYFYRFMAGDALSPVGRTRT